MESFFFLWNIFICAVWATNDNLDSFLLDTTVWVFSNHQESGPASVPNMWVMDILPRMVFIFCSKLAKQGGVIVPSGQRARSSPAPCWGLWADGLSPGDGLGTTPNRPGELWGGAICLGVTCLLLEDKCVINLSGVWGSQSSLTGPS